jgi:hypothetical protein
MVPDDRLLDIDGPRIVPTDAISTPTIADHVRPADVEGRNQHRFVRGCIILSGR